MRKNTMGMSGRHRSNLVCHCLFLLLLPAVIAMGQPIPIRICTYNLMTFPGTTLSQRVTSISTVIKAIRPDILVVQEMSNFTASTTLQVILSDSSGSRLVTAPQFDGPGTDNALLYDAATVEFLDHDTIQTEPRYTDVWRLVIRGTRDTIDVYGTDLEEGAAQEDQERRLSAAFAIRDHIVRSESQGSGHHYLVAGTLNVSSSSEPAYTRLTYIGGLSGEVIDPLNMPGNWHGNLNYAPLHTSSTRLREFGDGDGGGLNQRFDFLLLSWSLLADHFLPNSYTAFGNDGRHLNDSINSMPNTAVDQYTADALHQASDHLPVYLDLEFAAVASGVDEKKRMPTEMNLGDAR